MWESLLFLSLKAQRVDVLGSLVMHSGENQCAWYYETCWQNPTASIKQHNRVILWVWNVTFIAYQIEGHTTFYRTNCQGIHTFVNGTLLSHFYDILGFLSEKKAFTLTCQYCFQKWLSWTTLLSVESVCTFCWRQETELLHKVKSYWHFADIFLLFCMILCTETYQCLHRYAST